MINEQKKNNYFKTLSKISGISFTRAICTIGIIFYHYFSRSKGTFKLLRKTANSTWGFIFVTTFFCISGTVLYYNYPKIYSLKKFYYKRWKSIFPPFYICYFYFFLTEAFNSHKLFSRGHWTKIIYTLLGIDGYLSYKIKTYYLVGEWFLGAIIILYILYPLILLVVNKNICLSSFLIIILNFLLLKTNIFVISKFTNLITCINSFYFGIISVKYKTVFFENKSIYFLFCIIFIFLYKIKFKLSIILHLIQGFALFIILVQSNKYIKSIKIRMIINEISTLSYNIYLFHHHIIHDIQNLYNPEKWYLHLLLLTATLVLTIICAKIHFMTNKLIIQNIIFQKMDSFFLS